MAVATIKGPNKDSILWDLICGVCPLSRLDFVLSHAIINYLNTSFSNGDLRGLSADVSTEFTHAIYMCAVCLPTGLLIMRLN